MIVLVFGLPGSGKSVFAARLATILRADYINSDRIRKEMFRHSTYSEEEKAAVYEAMFEKMKAAMEQNNNLVLDATFHKNDTRKPFLTIGGKADIFAIEVWAAEETTKERLKNRRPYSEADYAIYQLIRQQWEPLTEPHLLLESTNKNIDALLHKATAYLHWKDDRT